MSDEIGAAVRRWMGRLGSGRFPGFWRFAGYVFTTDDGCSLHAIVDDGGPASEWRGPVVSGGVSLLSAHREPMGTASLADVVAWCAIEPQPCTRCGCAGHLPRPSTGDIHKRGKIGPAYINRERLAWILDGAPGDLLGFAWTGPENAVEIWTEEWRVLLMPIRNTLGRESDPVLKLEAPTLTSNSVEPS